MVNCAIFYFTGSLPGDMHTWSVDFIFIRAYCAACNVFSEVFCFFAFIFPNNIYIYKFYVKQSIIQSIFMFNLNVLGFKKLY